jgi:hypothetical protein
VLGDRAQAGDPSSVPATVPKTLHGGMSDLAQPSSPEPVGLSAAQARDRLQEDGPNVLPDPGGEGWGARAWTSCGTR